ncbi:protein phosphatase Slingshot homolog 3 isoform X2 [Protobothrops mucrosquamatus]|uniref:protein phosphatase Slingshot homolog 3 isoform X2 n=1 Tax=Protobothrops mucrosquamatus TaxID=103944 RepID=UPI000775650F|nr:protein phosphatase Slingshot homolog 3 isoform X2 [Protobothrops mucrosquamatus]
MALVTVCRSPSGSGHSTPTGCKDEDVPRRRQLQRRQSFVMVKGAALLLPEEDKLEAVQEGPATPLDQTPKSEDAIPGQQELHLQQMVGLLRPEDTIQLAVRLESARAHRIRYLLVVSATERESKNEMVLLGVDFPDESLATCTLGMVLPLWSDTQVFLDGDGGFSVTSGGQTRIFKPISVQTMWSALQVLHKACSEAVSNNYFPGGGVLNWTEWYQKAVNSDQSCINEWLAMSDLESVRPTSPSIFSDQPTARDVTERMIRAKLREVMGTTDLESITSKEIRTELEQRVGCSLKNYKEFIDNEMLLIMAQMDWPSKIFDYLYLGSEWNAANLEELQKNRVSHILNVTREIDNFFPEHFTYMNVRLYDEEASQLLPYWKETHSFISDVRTQGSRVLVHCKMGVSRSGSTVIAYAMKEYGWSLERALGHVRERRPIVHPNPGFMRQLELYQGMLDASRHSSLWEQKAGDAPSGGSSDISDASSDHSGSLEYETLSSDEEPEVPVTTPQYCFRPLHEPSQNPSQPLPPIVTPQLIPQATEEPGASDDSGAEEVRRHLASMKVPEKPAMLRRERINLYAIMRSISEMDSPEHTSVTGSTPEEEVFLHAERKICEPSSQSKENEKPVTAKLSLPGDQRAHGQRPGRRGRSRGSKVHAQPCKQLSYHPAPGKVHKAVRHMEGSGSCGRRPPLQHRLSVAQLADAALVVSRTKEFEGQMNPEISKKLQLPSSLPCSRSRQVVRQASIDMDPSSV